MTRFKFYYIFIILVPIVIYSILDIFLKNNILSISISNFTALIIFFLLYIALKRIEFIILFEICLIVILSLISFLSNNDMYFKLKPAIIESVILFIIILSGFSNRFFKFLIIKYFKINNITDYKLNKYQIYIFSITPLLIIHIPLIIITALFYAYFIWAFICGILLYLLLFIFIFGLIVSGKIKFYLMKKKYINDEWFDIVDEKSRVIGKAPRAICHNGTKLLHPVVHIHIINSSGQILLQKRSLEKKIQPGKWDTSVGGHIASGEKLEDALKREVKEEAGIDIDIKKLIPLNKYIFESSIEKEYVFSFIYKYNGKIIHQESEIDEMKYFSLDEIKKLIELGLTTENFIKEYSFLKKIII